MATRLIPALAFWLCAAAAWAGDWSMRTTLDDGRGKGSAETTTYFAGGKIYDFAGEPPQVTIFDPAAGRFTIVDLGRRLRTEITSDEINELTTRLTAAALRHGDPLRRFAAEPKLETTLDRRTGELRLESTLLTYRARLSKPDSADAVREYRAMADAFARLNGVLPGRLPPAARLALNEQVASGGNLPSSVELSTRDSASAKWTTRRSTHEATWKLSPRDRERIDEAVQLSEAYERVGFARFHGLESRK
jgi:hypothetical protein